MRRDDKPKPVELRTDFRFYTRTAAEMHLHTTKPLMFDLVLLVPICVYLLGIHVYFKVCLALAAAGRGAKDGQALTVCKRPDFPHRFWCRNCERCCVQEARGSAGRRFICRRHMSHFSEEPRYVCGDVAMPPWFGEPHHMLLALGIPNVAMWQCGGLRFPVNVAVTKIWSAYPSVWRYWPRG